MTPARARSAAARHRGTRATARKGSAEKRLPSGPGVPRGSSVRAKNSNHVPHNYSAAAAADVVED